MAQPPRLAVVIPCYNYAAYVGEAIESVVSQGRDDVELVVVDDGSTDASWEVISTFPGLRAERIPNGGSVKACVHGLDMTTAPFVLFLDADDRIEPGSLANILVRLDPSVAKLQFSLGRIDAAGVRIGPAVPTVSDFRDRERLIAEVSAHGVYLTPPTSGNVFRRDVADLLREVDYQGGSADGVTVFAAPFFGDVVSVSAELGRYRVHGRNISSVGRVSPASLTYETRRFEATMLHLRQVLNRLGHVGGLPVPTDLFVHREMDFARKVAIGERPAISSVAILLARLARYSMPPKHKIALALFFGLAAALPSSRSKALLAYRYQASGRGLKGFLITALRGAPATRPEGNPT